MLSVTWRAVHNIIIISPSLPKSYVQKNISKNVLTIDFGSRFPQNIDSYDAVRVSVIIIIRPTLLLPLLPPGYLTFLTKYISGIYEPRLPTMVDKTPPPSLKRNITVRVVCTYESPTHPTSIACLQRKQLWTGYSSPTVFLLLFSKRQHPQSRPSTK